MFLALVLWAASGCSASGEELSPRAATGGTAGRAAGGSNHAGSGGASTSGTGGGGAEVPAGSAGESSGGSAGSGGATADAASAEAAPPLPDFEIFNFDHDVGTFVFDTYGTGDAGMSNVLSDKAKISWDGADGAPNKGSMKIEIPFSAYNQQALFVVMFGDSDMRDFSKQILYFQIKLDSGFSPPDAPGGLVFYSQTTTAFLWGQSPWRNPPPAGMWEEYGFDLRQAEYATAGFDPSKVKTFGIKIDTGSGEGATAPPAPAVFHIDTIMLRSQ